MKTITVLNRLRFNSVLKQSMITDQTVRTRDDLCFVSINKTKTKRSEAYFEQDHDNVLTLFFDDVGEKDDNAFTQEQGKKVINFFKRNKNKTGILIHCDAGISRSGAIGEFCADYFGIPYEEFKRKNPRVIPNGHVLRTLRRLARENN